MHPPPSFPPQNTGVVVIDSLSTLIDNAYPRNINTKHKTDQSRWAASRRFAVINELISTFSKFAALHDLALLITCQTITRIRGSSRAVLVPAISGVEWENGVSTRLVLFRDWVRQASNNDSADADRLRRARFVGLVKANGVALADEGGVGSVVPFVIDQVSVLLGSNLTIYDALTSGCVLPVKKVADAMQTGLCDVDIATNGIGAPFLTAQSRTSKRPYDEIDEQPEEEPNSDELYGWIEEDGFAAEGLLIEDAPGGVAETTDTRTNKMVRTTTE